MGLPAGLMSRAVNYQRATGIQPAMVRLVLGGCDDPDPSERRGTRPCLLRPPHWPVYLEGDQAMEWRYAAEVIDKIEGWHVKVVLPGSRRR